VEVTPARCAPPKRKAIPAGKLKKATPAEVLRSSQFHQDDVKSKAFWNRWVKESTEWRLAQKTRLSNRNDAKQLRARALAKRDADKLARMEAEDNRNAERKKARGFDQLMRQGGKAERQRHLSKGGVFVGPSEDVPDKKSGYIPLIKIRQAPNIITMPEGNGQGKRKAEALSMLREAETVDYWLRCGDCNIWRKLASGSLKPRRDAWISCGQVGEKCGHKSRKIT